MGTIDAIGRVKKITSHKTLEGFSNIEYYPTFVGKNRGDIILFLNDKKQDTHSSGVFDVLKGKKHHEVIPDSGIKEVRIGDLRLILVVANAKGETPILDDITGQDVLSENIKLRKQNVEIKNELKAANISIDGAHKNVAKQVQKANSMSRSVNRPYDPFANKFTRDRYGNNIEED